MKLLFSYDGTDMTKSTTSETQNALDALVDTSVLPKLCFFGQHLSTRGLLELTDKSLKDELARIVPLEK